MNVFRKPIVLILLLFILLLTACDGSPSILLSQYYPVDSLFLSFYESLGGEELLGPALSPIFENRGVQYQYTAGALMVHNPGAPANQKFTLAEVTKGWNIQEPAEPVPQDPSVPYINGHVVWEEVLPLYQKYGAAIFGVPLTGVKYNLDKRQYEQYFSNVGFYRSENDPPGVESIHMLHFGAIMCGDACGSMGGIAVSDEPLKPAPASDDALQNADSIFMEIASRLGLEFTGQPLKETYQAQDGMFEKVFENVVLYADPLNPTQIKLRPLPNILGIPADPPVPPSGVQGTYFYQTGDNLGYNVPEIFMDYVTLHGTMEISGPPITELHAILNDYSRQCFTNLCLEYHANAPENLRIRPSAFGHDYLNRFSGGSIQPQVEPSPGVIRVQVWEGYPLVATYENQFIGVAIYEDDKPLSGVEFVLTINMPDGSSPVYYLIPSTSDGQSQIILNPIEAPNGTTVSYKMCVLGLNIPNGCVEDSFIIWENPP